MRALPFLLEHGAAVWQTSLVLFVLAGLAVGPLRARIAARRAARAVRAALGPPLSLLAPSHEGELVTISGRVEEIEGPCRRFEDGGDAAAASIASDATPAGTHARAERVTLRVGDAFVRLEGPIEVAAGSREAWPGRPTAVMRSIAHGDLVRVRGVLKEEASDDATSYRTAAKRWILGHGEGSEQALVAAFEGTPRVTGPVATVRAGHAVAAAALFFAAFGVLGEAAMAVSADRLAEYAFSNDMTLDEAMALTSRAAITPFQRRAALDRLSQTLDARRDADPRSLAVREALHKQRGRDAESAAMWIAQGEPERGAQLAHGAHHYGLEARGWYAAGYFEHAADAWEGSEMDYSERELTFGVGVNLLAERPERAAHAARRLAAALRGHVADNDRLRRWYDERATVAGCIADALDARRGDAEAWKSLHAERSSPLPPACAVLRVDLFDGQQRVDAIRALPALSQNVWDVPADWLSLLAFEADPASSWPAPPPFDAPRAIIVPNDGTMAALVPALDRAIAGKMTAHDTTTWRREALASAVFALLSGDKETAGEIGAPLLSDEIVADLTRRPAPDDGEKDAWRYILEGNGYSLARWMRRSLSQPGTFLRFGVSHLDRGRIGVAAEVRWGYRPVAGFRPTDEVIRLANLAAAAAQLGEDAAPLQERTGRFRTAILRRETAIPLAVLERL